MLKNLCTDSVLFYTCLYKGEKQIRKEICHFISFLLSRLWFLAATMMVVVVVAVAQQRGRHAMIHPIVFRYV